MATRTAPPPARRRGAASLSRQADGPVVPTRTIPPTRASIGAAASGARLRDGDLGVWMGTGVRTGRPRLLVAARGAEFESDWAVEYRHVWPVRAANPPTHRLPPTTRGFAAVPARAVNGRMGAVRRAEGARGS